MEKDTIIETAIIQMKEELKKEAAKNGDGKYNIPISFLSMISFAQGEELMKFIKELKPSVVVNGVNDKVIYF